MANSTAELTTMSHNFTSCALTRHMFMPVHSGRSVQGLSNNLGRGGGGTTRLPNWLRVLTSLVTTPGEQFSLGLGIFD